VPGESDDASPGAAAQDPEELRYAPRAPRRFEWLRRLLLLVAVLAVLALAAKLAYDWTQRQYYVGATDDGRVAVFQGIEQSLLGYEPSQVHTTYDLNVDTLPTFLRDKVDSGIAASDLAAAERIVDDLQSSADQCSGDNPDPEECAGAEPTEATPSSEATTETEETPTPSPQQPRRDPSPDRPGDGGAARAAGGSR
jgi:protein phosphatase